MGNRICKKKTDAVDNATVANGKKSRSFDKIFSRLHLKPTTWKSDSHLNKKQVSRYEEVTPKKRKHIMNDSKTTKPLSKSSDWTSAELEAPERSVDLKSPKLVLICNEKNPPTPPPRKNKKKGLKERIETVTKNSIQALNMRKSTEENKTPVEEPLFVKKIIHHTCPVCERDELLHNKNHDHSHGVLEKMNAHKLISREEAKINKRKKNLSVVSLPNYSELKLAVAHFDDIDKNTDSATIHNSMTSIPNETKKLSHASSAGKLEAYMTRCRSFGSLFPQHLMDKIRNPKKPVVIGSDDSFGSLQDWDLRILEHYNPRDASLPRPRKPQKTEKEVVSDLESLIVKDEEIERPVPPARRSLSPIKKSRNVVDLTAVNNNNNNNVENHILLKTSLTPVNNNKNELSPPINYSKIKDDDKKIEHSSLMKILQECSLREKRRSAKLNGEVDDESILDFIDASSTRSSKKSSLTSSMVEDENKVSYIQDFINAEKSKTSLDLSTKYGNLEKAKT